MLQIPAILHHQTWNSATQNYEKITSHVTIIGFFPQNAYHNPDSPNYDVAAELKAVIIKDDNMFAEVYVWELEYDKNRDKI